MTGKSVKLVIPGDISKQTGGYIYDRRVLSELAQQGFMTSHISLGDSFPEPSQADIKDAREKLSGLSAEEILIIDGLALGAMDPELVRSLQTKLVALIHHPLAYEGNLDMSLRERFFETEQINLKACSRVIVPSPHTKDLLIQEYGIEESKITVAKPGIDFNPCTQQKLEPPLVLSVGIQAHRKGHDVFLNALSRLTHLDWQAVIAGSVQDEEYANQLERLMEDLNLGDRVRIESSVSSSDLPELYCQATVFALATRYEGYGMVFAEAMSYGLPIVSCDTGAVPDTVAPGAGKLVPVDDVESFAYALAEVLEDNSARDAMAVASKEAGQKLGSWMQTAEIVGGVLDSL